MNSLIIAVVVFVVVVTSSVLLLSYIKKKIRNKLIDKGADIITKAAGNVLDEEAAGKVSKATNATAKILKNGKKTELISEVAKKGFELVKERSDEKLI